MKETVVKYEQYIIQDSAILETRHYHKELGLKYKRLIFIDMNYLCEMLKIKNQTIKSTKRNKFPLEQPKEKNYLEYSQVLKILSETEINIILIDLLKKCRDFYMVNFIFPLIVKRNDFNEGEVNFIVNYSIGNSKVKKSFAAQSLMIDFINNNKAKLHKVLFKKALNDFPPRLFSKNSELIN